MASIVAISRQFGSGGAWVGRAVAQQLGFQYADREILAAAASELKVQAADLEPMEERTASIWERIGTLFALGAPDTPFIPPTLPSVTESRLFEVEQEVIKSVAAHGNAVLVGRGAAHILQESSDVLRVFLHARWVSAQVAGCSSAHVILATQQGDSLQTLGRAALYRLHESGLATTIEPAAAVSDALQSLTLDLE